jgi:hypothetical protein
MTSRLRFAIARHLTATAVVSLALTTPSSNAAAAQASQRTFASPEEAVHALAAAVKSGKADEVLAIFGPDGRELAASSDPSTARENAEVFTVAFGESWRLVDEGANKKTLVIGNEAWPFPVPLVRQRDRWQFDTAAGKEEVIARRIGRNELQAIDTCREYVAAQLRYAKDGHDGKRAGLYAQAFRSDPGRQNGLYWPAERGQKRSPLGDLVAQATTEGRALGERSSPQPFYGYYFKILTGQGANVPGKAKSYIVDGDLSGGFALVAWPAEYDVTGVMTFLVNQDGAVRQKDLGRGTDAAARGMTVYNPDSSWSKVQ